MASLYLQKKSQFFYLKHRDATGVVRRFSTKFSRLNPVDVRRAKQLEAQYTLQERSHDGQAPTRGWDWVEPFLATAYRMSAGTLERYRTAWVSLNSFIEEKKIAAPAHFTRQHCFEYMTWRRSPDLRRGKYRATHNTALLELKTMRILMNEAVIRKYCQGNPCLKLGIHREAARQSPDLTNDQIALIRQRIAEVKSERLRAFLEITFEIGRWQGCRLNATRLNPLRDVVLKGDSGTIHFVSKGKDFITLLHPQLVPLFKRLQREQCATTWEPPAGAARSWPSVQWTKFLQRSGLKQEIPGLSHRSFRVTVVTRMARNNVPISKAKEFIKHASTTIHFVYQRLSPEDLTDCAKAIE